MMNSKTTPNDRQIRNSEITPPPELVEQWIYEDGDEVMTSSRWYRIVCTKAARWGADQELDACCDWLLGETEQSCINELRAARRPKSPSLAEEALSLLNEGPASDLLDHEVAIIRSALERLQEHEQQVEAQVNG